jgi:Tol biopolymer transport system component
MGMSPTKRWPLAIALIAASVIALPVPANASRVPSAVGRILFMGTRDGNADLYVVSRESRRARAVVSSPGHDCGPAAIDASPALVFSSMRLDGSSDPGGHFQLYKMDPRSGKVRRLTTTPGHNFGASWSPDGKHIAFSSTRNGSLGAPNWPVSSGSIFVMNADGSHAKQITDAASSETHNFPAWSPDGKWIAFQSTSKTEPLRPSIHVVRPNGEGRHIVQYDGMYPTWSPDSKRIAFNSARAGRVNEQDLYVMDADGSDARRLTKPGDGAEFMPSWSSDGKQLVYVNDPDGWTDVAAVTLLPTGHTQDVYSSGPAESSIWVADLSRAQGTYKIVAVHQRTSGGNDLFPKFAPDWLR